MNEQERAAIEMQRAADREQARPLVASYLDEEWDKLVIGMVNFHDLVRDLLDAYPHLTARAVLSEMARMITERNGRILETQALLQGGYGYLHLVDAQGVPVALLEHDPHSGNYYWREMEGKERRDLVLLENAVQVIVENDWQIPVPEGGKANDR